MKHQKTNERKIFKKIKLMGAYIFALFNFSFLQKRMIQIRRKSFFSIGAAALWPTLMHRWCIINR